MIIFLYLFGCDINGYVYWLYLDIYLNNINFVDCGIESIVKFIEEYFFDGKIVYVFMFDYGMSNKG